jgi:hypothetical protein
VKDIEETKYRLLARYAKKYCQLSDPSKCSKDRCSCRMMAEVGALMKCVIPPGFQKFTIKDFDGQTSAGRILLEPTVATEAKKRVAHYCWGEKVSLQSLSTMSDEDRLGNVVIGQRVDRGNNVVIYGSSPLKSDVDKDGHTIWKSRPRGRTFVAAILTREAIKLRAFKGYHDLLYGWVEFPTLMSMLYKDTYEATNYQSCNWLVVDNITEGVMSGSAAQTAYRQSVLDPFLTSRLDQNLVTVLIFKFDLRKQQSMISDTFGPAMDRIIRRADTCRIDLSCPVGETKDA